MKLQTSPSFPYKIFKSYITVIQMLEDRKYTIPDDYKFDDDHFEYFMEWVGLEDGCEDTSLDMDILHLEFEKANGAKILTFWFPTLGKNDVQQIYETLREQNVKNAVVIHVNKITSSATPVLKNCKVQGYTIEPFMVSELQFNPTHHEYVSRHIICTAKHKNEIMEKYSLTKDKLPKILFSDPQCRYWGATRGQLIKIVRPSITNPKVILKKEEKQLFDITYRLVV